MKFAITYIVGAVVLMCIGMRSGQEIFYWLSGWVACRGWMMFVEHITSGVDLVDLPQQHESPEKWVSKADMERAHGVQATAKPGEGWPEGAHFTDMEGGYYDEQGEPLKPAAGVEVPRG